MVQIHDVSGICGPSIHCGITVITVRHHGGFRGAFHLQGQPRNRQVATDGLVAAGFRFGKVPVVEKVIPLKPKLFGNTHFWLER